MSTDDHDFNFDLAWDRLRAELGDDHFRYELKQHPQALVIRPFVYSVHDAPYLDHQSIALGIIKVAYYARDYIRRLPFPDRHTIGINVSSNSTVCNMEHPLVRRAVTAVWNEIDRQSFQFPE